MNMKIERINICGLDMEYTCIGSGIPLIFLHGMGGSIRQITGTCDPIDGVRLIIPNQPGHGSSEADWENYSFDTLADSIIALTDALQLPQAYFAGISMGAAVCLNIALRYPARAKALLLIRNAWTDSPMSEDVQTAYHDMGLCLKSGGPDAFQATRGWQIVCASRSAYTSSAFISPFKDESCLRFWQKYLILPALVPVADASSLAKLQIPTAILANADDLCHPLEYGKQLAERIPGAIFTEIPSKDADPNLHREMINRAVQKMLFG